MKHISLCILFIICYIPHGNAQNELEYDCSHHFSSGINADALLPISELERKLDLDRLTTEYSFYINSEDPNFERFKNPQSLKILADRISKFPCIEGAIFRVEGKVDTLPDLFPSLQNIWYLTIETRGRNSSIKALPESIGNLKKLQSLFLTSDGDIYIPSSIGQFRNLKELSLTIQNVNSLPADIGQLPVTWLSITSRGSQPLKVISHFKSVKHLHLELPNVQTLEACLFELKNLKILEFEEVRLLRRLPDLQTNDSFYTITIHGADKLLSLGNLPNIKHLNVLKIFSTDLSPQAFRELKSCNNIDEIVLDYYSLSKINLKKLARINSRIPVWIGDGSPAYPFEKKTSDSKRKRLQNRLQRLKIKYY